MEKVNGKSGQVRGGAVCRSAIRAFYGSQHAKAIRYASAALKARTLAEEAVAMTYVELLEQRTSPEHFFRALKGNVRNLLERNRRDSERAIPIEDIAEFHSYIEPSPLDLLIKKESEAEQKRLIKAALKDPRWRFIKRKKWAQLLIQMCRKGRLSGILYEAMKLQNSRKGGADGQYGSYGISGQGRTGKAAKDDRNYGSSAGGRSQRAHELDAQKDEAVGRGCLTGPDHLGGHSVVGEVQLRYGSPVMRGRAGHPARCPARRSGAFGLQSVKKYLYSAAFSPSSFLAGAKNASRPHPRNEKLKRWWGREVVGRRPPGGGVWGIVDCSLNAVTWQ